MWSFWGTIVTPESLSCWLAQHLSDSGCSAVLRQAQDDMADYQNDDELYYGPTTFASGDADTGDEGIGGGAVGGTCCISGGSAGGA